MKTFHLVSLGCPKNLVDSEVVFGQLEYNGWQGVEQPENANLLVVNTCGFIQSAVEESIEEIFQLAVYKQQDPRKKLAVIGCLVQRYRKRLESEIPEVDLFVGTEGVKDIHFSLNQLFRDDDFEKTVIPEPFLMTAAMPRRLSTPFFRAWLKITEGCNNHCSYCLIPGIRGRLRSRSIEDLVAEAKKLEAQGVKEVSLVAQDLTAYGMDVYHARRLVELLEQLLARTAISWIRLMYLYPSGINDQLLDLVSQQPRIVPYLDIPLQHVSDHILKDMNRRYGYGDVVQLIDKLRNKLPNIALRTTFLLGFPGETDADVQQLVDFIEAVQFDHLGVFSYANEEGCPAEKFNDQIPEEVKQARLETVLDVQSKISARKLQKYVGTVESVIIEGLSRETDLLLEGRTRYQAPDIDGCVLINEGNASPGDILDVEITEAHMYDLVGRIV
ncbi:MAG: 30S ribosomal protein S12 methylthiotransferase RimO [Deltaproteobacteria bacterium]|nr:30S ribosomal protein S12 methylthiotransferase RimO [Deltaproteobacteria bacterium]